MSRRSGQLLDDGIDQDKRHGDGTVELHAVLLLGLLGDVDHADALGATDLLGGKADALGVVHALQHVLGELADIVRDLANLDGLLAEYVLAVCHNRIFHQGPFV